MPPPDYSEWKLLLVIRTFWMKFRVSGDYDVMDKIPAEIWPLCFCKTRTAGSGFDNDSHITESF